MADQFVNRLDSARQVCERRAAHMVSLKIGQSALIDECRRIAELCLAFGIRVHVGGGARPIVADAAHAQFAASVPGIGPEAEVGESFALTNDLTGGVTSARGAGRSPTRMAWESQ